IISNHFLRDIMNINELKELIKLQLACPNWRKIREKIKHHKKITFYIIGGPVHGNLGDHAIMEEEKEFVKEFFPQYECVEILMPFYHTQKKFLCSAIKKDDVVCISGGGWMGNLWLHNEITVRDIIKAFQDNTIIIFPQTLYYTHDTAGEKELLKTINIFSEHKNLIFCLRDQKSYDLVNNRFVLNGNSVSFLCPDMVLFCHSKTPKRQREKNINVCIRDDCEALNNISLDNIKEIIPEEYNVTVIDTVVPRHVSLKNRHRELEASWEQFAKSQLTITDRLHAMLFSYINGTPCIALDNKTGKVFGVYKWIEKQGITQCANSIDDIEYLIPKMLTSTPKEIDKAELLGKYVELATIIKEKGRL
ncbi:MAG: polysaccharide pyruvyl transferase family protein, partial [Roseburia sp.]